MDGCSNHDHLLVVFAVVRASCNRFGCATLSKDMERLYMSWWRLGGDMLLWHCRSVVSWPPNNALRTGPLLEALVVSLMFRGLQWEWAEHEEMHGLGALLAGSGSME